LRGLTSRVRSSSASAHHLPHADRCNPNCPAKREISQDLASGIFEVLPITNPHYVLAEELAGRYGFRHRLRTLDALQLAVVLSQSKYAAIDGFVLADRVLFEVASVEKLPTIRLL
jgi:hypothetical protein